MDPLDPELVEDFARRAKRQLRKRARALRAAYPAPALAERSRKIAQRVVELGLFERAQGVALFWPMQDRNEVDLRVVDAAARAAGKRIYYPFMDPTPSGFTTGFRLTTDVDELVDRGRGFAEPDPASVRAERGDIDLVVVPALAVSPLGHRLGYGAGFYDATLPDVCPPARALVVAFDFQLLAELPVSEGDVRCDGVVTDIRTIDAHQAR